MKTRDILTLLAFVGAVGFMTFVLTGCASAPKAYVPDPSEYRLVLGCAKAKAEGYQPDGALVRCAENRKAESQMGNHITETRRKVIGELQMRCLGAVRIDEDKIHHFTMGRNPWVCVLADPDAVTCN